MRKEKHLIVFFMLMLIFLSANACLSVEPETENVNLLLIDLKEISIKVFIESERHNNLSEKEDEVLSEPEIKDYISEIGQIDGDQEYESFLDFPYFELAYVTDDIYEIIKTEYFKIDFASNFKTSGSGVNDLYKEQFKQLLENEKQFLDKQGNALYMNQLEPAYLLLDEDAKPEVNDNYNVNNFQFNLMDMDGDEKPELCVTDCIDLQSIYIFKYFPDQDQIELWYKTNVSWTFLHGSGTLYSNYGGLRQTFCKLDKEGKEIFTIFFFEREDFNRLTNQPEVEYMVSLPNYSALEQQIEITEEISQQAYFAKDMNCYCFRVTKEQFDELTGEYFEEQMISTEKIKELTYSYGELFGE
ncbi:MAG: hypothetical protein LBV33_03895 [Lachnospiraceae bacterium]|jgi:hypothetical protein|nr:hypothetical protein [Lachnospiraceae bacterium]